MTPAMPLSQQSARSTRLLNTQRRSLWWLLAFNVILAALMIFSIGRVLTLTNTLQDTREAQNMGCKRGNVSRETQRYVLGVLVRMSLVVGNNATDPTIRNYFSTIVPELRAREAAPEIAELPCDLLYPIN